MHPTTTTTTSARGNGAQATDLQSTLRRIEARLARLEQTLEPIAELGAHAPAIIATAGDIIDETALELGDVDERVRGAIDVLERLTRPATLEHLRKLVDMVEDAPNVVATGMDILDELMDEAGREGMDLPNLMNDLKGLVFGLLRIAPRLHQLLDSGMLDERTVRTLGLMGKAMAEAEDVEPPRVGLFGAMRAMRDVDLQRALGFALNVGAGLGRALKREKKRLTA